MIYDRQLGIFSSSISKVHENSFYIYSNQKAQRKLYSNRIIALGEPGVAYSAKMKFIPVAKQAL